MKKKMLPNNLWLNTILSLRFFILYLFKECLDGQTTCFYYISLKHKKGNIDK